MPGKAAFCESWCSREGVWSKIKSSNECVSSALFLSSQLCLPYLHDNMRGSPAAAQNMQENCKEGSQGRGGRLGVHKRENGQITILILLCCSREMFSTQAEGDSESLKGKWLVVFTQATHMDHARICTQTLAKTNPLHRLSWQTS